MKLIAAISASALAALVAACAQPVKETPASASLGEMEGPPVYEQGFKRVNRYNGSTEVTTEVVDVTDETITWQSSNGCKYTRSALGFAPSLKWSNCDTTGTQEFELVHGTPWPLKLGKNWRYTLNGTNTDGNSWKGERSCTVEAETKVAVPMGTFDTYKVVCRDPWRVRTWYVSPEVGEPVLYIHRNPRQNQIDKYELVRLVPAGS